MAEACPRCGIVEADLVDEDGQPHDPPILEAVAMHCKACAERARMEAALERDVRSQVGEGPKGDTQARRILASHFVTLGRYDPFRGLGDGAD